MNFTDCWIANQVRLCFLRSSPNVCFPSNLCQMPENPCVGDANTRDAYLACCSIVLGQSEHASYKILHATFYLEFGIFLYFLQSNATNQDPSCSRRFGQLTCHSIHVFIELYLSWNASAPKNSLLILSYEA